MTPLIPLFIISTSRCWTFHSFLDLRKDPAGIASFWLDGDSPIRWFPKIGLPPVIIHFRWGFSINHPMLTWGIPIRTPHMLHVHPRVLCDAGRCEQPPGIEEMAHQRGNFRMPGTHHNTVPTWSVSIGYSVPQMGLTQNGVILQMVLSYWNNCFSTIVFCFIFCSNFQTNPYWLGWRNSASFGQCPKFRLLDDCRGYERTWRKGF